MIPLYHTWFYLSIVFSYFFHKVFHKFSTTPTLPPRHATVNVAKYVLCDITPRHGKIGLSIDGERKTLPPRHADAARAAHGTLPTRHKIRLAIDGERKSVPKNRTKTERRRHNDAPITTQLCFQRRGEVAIFATSPSGRFRS